MVTSIPIHTSPGLGMQFERSRSLTLNLLGMQLEPFRSLGLTWLGDAIGRSRSLGLTWLGMPSEPSRPIRLTRAGAASGTYCADGDGGRDDSTPARAAAAHLPRALELGGRNRRAVRLRRRDESDQAVRPGGQACRASLLVGCWLYRITSKNEGYIRYPVHPVFGISVLQLDDQDLSTSHMWGVGCCVSRKNRQL